MHQIQINKTCFIIGRRVKWYENAIFQYIFVSIEYTPAEQVYIGVNDIIFQYLTAINYHDFD